MPSREPQLPAIREQGYFTHMPAALRLAMEHCGVEAPATLYYPGCGDDGSLLALPELDVIHADASLSETAMSGFAQKSAEVHQRDVHEWGPPDELDIITFINATGINPVRTLSNCRLREDGIALWAHWMPLPPRELQDDPTLDLKTVIRTGDDSMELQTDQLEDYFEVKSFQELTPDEKATFIARLAEFIRIRRAQAPRSITQLYNYLVADHVGNYSVLQEMRYTPVPKRRVQEGDIFIYQKVAGAAA